MFSCLEKSRKNLLILSSLQWCYPLKWPVSNGHPQALIILSPSTIDHFKVVSAGQRSPPCLDHWPLNVNIKNSKKGPG